MADADDFYISSLSSTKVVYKRLIMAHQLEHFYHDLNDESMVTSFALIHSRFSTNTLGSWKLAHPYRYIIHNGEINTLRGNINWMAAREAALSSPMLGERVRKLLPVLSPAQSDTATFDNVLDLILAMGRSLPHALMMIPEAWAEHIPMEQSKKDYYEYHSCLMEPWDGPALIIGTDGTKVCAILDRNGLRPCRYLVTTDDVLVMASETGVLEVPPEKIRFKWRIQPGRMFMLDTEQGRIVGDEEIKAELTGRRPYGKWLRENRVLLEELPETSKAEKADFSTLTERQKAFGYSQEDIGMIIEPMTERGAEPIGSMGNDAPLAVLSDQSPLLYGYFKHLFAQVSNPPLDAMREELVTSVETFVGSEGNLFDETPEQCRQLKVSEPILRDAELAKIKEMDRNGIRSATLSILFRPGDGAGALERAMELLCRQASEAIEEGNEILVLSDKGVNAEHAPIPSLMAVAGVHHHLIREGTRTKVGLVVETGEAREVAHFVLLFGYGAGAVNPYLAFETIAGMVAAKPGGISYEEAEENFVHAVHKGVLKVMSKMGISTLQGCRGAQVFEAVGLRQELVDRYFTWTPSRIGGIGIGEIEDESKRRHNLAYREAVAGVYVG